jgi:hypothetical protein
MDAQTKAVVKKYFGEDASIKRKLWGWYRISSPLGEAKFHEEKGFPELVGGPEIYRSSVLTMEELLGWVPVSGTPEHITATLAHCESLGIQAVPEVRDGDGCLTFLIGIAFFSAADIFSWPGILIGIAVWALGVRPWIKKRLALRARRAGQKYRNVFPEIHGSDRDAKRDAARSRGLL